MVNIGYDPTFVSTVLGQVLARQEGADAAARDCWNTAVGLLGPPPQGTYTPVVKAAPATTPSVPTPATPTPSNPAPGYQGPARRKTRPKSYWVGGNAGWVKPTHTNFEAELIQHYDNVAPVGMARALQVQKLRTRNASHGGVSGRPAGPAIFLPETL